jgi:hypothetical protein
MHLTGDAAIRRRAREIPAVYVIFDLLSLEALDGEIERAHVDRRRVGRLAGTERHPLHSKRVGHRRGLEVHVETAVQRGRWRAVDVPAAGPIVLQVPLVVTRGAAARTRVDRVTQPASTPIAYSTVQARPS